MIWPYLRTGSPAAMSARATLCPSAIGSRTSTVRPPTVSDEPLGDRPGGDRHVVVAPEQDRPPLLGRRRHALDLLSLDCVQDPASLASLVAARRLGSRAPAVRAAGTVQSCLPIRRR